MIKLHEALLSGETSNTFTVQSTDADSDVHIYVYGNFDTSEVFTLQVYLEITQTWVDFRADDGSGTVGTFTWSATTYGDKRLRPPSGNYRLKGDGAGASADVDVEVSGRRVMVKEGTGA